MTRDDLREIALRFAIQADRTAFAESAEAIVKRASTYFDFLTGKEAPTKKLAKRK